MLGIKMLKIKGFRGYVDEKEFTFETPVIILFGENHRGKSSTLNAIEWCLFGKECIGRDTGIRERIDWEVRNRNLPLKDEVFVEIELKDENNDTFKIMRKWISKEKDELQITLPDGQLLTKEEAEKRLDQILKCSFRDFLTTVYQHQEAIRAILTQEPRDRNDAIDRLLGLSDYRNILSGINEAKIDEKQRKLNEKLEIFKGNIETALKTRQKDLEEKRKELINKGIKESFINENGAYEIAKIVKEALSQFASEIGLTLTDLPISENWKEIKEKFLDKVNKEITRFRSEMPDVKRQGELVKEKHKITSLQSILEIKNKKYQDAKKKIEEFIKDIGDEEKLNNTKSHIEKQIALKEKELKEINAKGKTISEAIEYLKLESIDKNICPVCEKETPDLLTHLEQEWNKKYKEQMGKIKDEREKLKKDLDNVEQRLKQLRELDKNKKTAENELKEIYKEIAAYLKREITEKDDPSTILAKHLNELDEEINKLKESIDSRQKKLDDIQEKAKELEQILEILNLEEKRKIVEEIKETPEYKKIEDLKDKMAELANELNKIKEAINQASHEEAKEKIIFACKKINELFCKITNNPAISKIELSVTPDSRTGRNNYEFKDQNGKDLTPILSQGDLNALALSIFLGLSSLNNQFGFLMLDDPSQSLGSAHKEKFVEILDDISAHRSIILSTMDKELQDLIVSKLTKAKTKYIFTNWTPTGGPEVRRE